VADPSTAGRWLAAFHEWTLPRTLLVPADPATIGYAVPAAVGAAVTGTPDPVVAVIGDQGLLARLGELAVLAREKLPLTVLVVDDGGAGRLRPDLVAMGLAADALDRPGPDLAAAARTFGLRADAIDVVGDELTAALRAHVAAPDPTVLVLRARLDLPPTDRSRWYRRPEER
jgi:thiamine pyrophosphate-dependent acetolactate synthase large subunit-like protein